MTAKGSRRVTVDDTDRRTGVPERARFQQLQALEDAIAYRRARLAVPCPDCGPAETGRKCDDHACDVDLIACYWQTARTAHRELSASTRERRAGTAHAAVKALVRDKA
jgi:hypothetical protein